ncbi:MAG: EAL domain-containing protein [bacterium]|nr:EAL domain-containing protein [bacterium]
MSLRHTFARATSRLAGLLPDAVLPRAARAPDPAADPNATTAMEKLDAALNNMSHGLCMFGPDDRLMLWNDRYVRMYKIAPGRLRVGSTLEEMLDARKEAGTAYRDLGQYDSKLTNAITKRSPDSLVAELDDGRIVNVSYRPTHNGCWVSTHEDITERAQNEARIAHLAFHDQLTGLPNRVAFNEHIAAAVHNAAGDTAFAVLCVDLDQFKEVNDVYGHSTGDRFLVEVGRRLLAASDGAFLARLGADEFIVIASVGPQPAMAEDLCTRLVAVLYQPVCVDGYEIEGSLTIGASVYPLDGADVDTLVGNAEAALYRAKADQRGSIRFFEPAMGRQIREKRALQHDIGAALARRELQLHFQPQSLAGGEIFGFEALLRWRHPERGVVSPAIFIPLAEETGAIGEIDEWVLREACREAASWPRPLSIAVNLSPVDFRRSDVAAMILSVLLETGLDPQRLEIEITEGVLFEDFDRALSILRRIKNLGVRVAMDDFGTGYSSLSYLQAFPFDKIKIDQSFTARIGSSFEAAAIIHAILGLGRALALPVIAEGVETEEQRAFLAQEGCEAQGYLIGRPEPIARYRHLVDGMAAPPESAVIAS